MASLSYEDRVVLALEAVQNSKNLSIRAAAELYNVQRATLQNRRDGKPARRDTSANSKKLTQSEEEAIVQYVIELSARAFPPRLCGVEDMANQLLRERDAPPVGKLWAHRFVKRQPEIRTRYTRRYDYQRAKCEDPKIIGEWFALVQNTKAKYGILDEDIHNFDETGFVMGMIFPGMVVTTSDGRGKAKLAQPGNREWATVIQGVCAQGWAIPPFIILAAQYHLANWYTECNLPADWRIATTKNGWTTNAVGLDWIKHFDRHTASRTKGVYRLLILDGHESHHSTEFELYCQHHKIITLLCMPPHSHRLQALDVGCFGPLKQAYGRQVALLRTEVSLLRKANEALSKRRRAKKTRVQLGGSITVQEVQDLLAQGAVGGEVVQEMQQDGGAARGACTKVRCCSVCRKPGHNARTCKKATESSDSAVSDVITVSS